VTDATVSNVLNSKGRTSEATRARVLEAAAALGYRRNELARAVVTGRSRTLGILTHDEANEAMLRTLAGALGEAASHDYATKLMYLPFQADEGEVQRVLERCTTWRLDGALVVGLSDDHIAMLRDEMAQGDRPVAFRGRPAPRRAASELTATTKAVGGWRCNILLG
jgi:LacI family transcriptional regulator